MSRDKSVRPYNSPAGGWGALKAVGTALLDQGVPVTGVKSLMRMNKPEGFDCPGCAWPDPKHGSQFEFCENGAKALAWEATAKRCDPNFFAKHSVTELEQWNDHELENHGRLTHPMVYDANSDHYVPVSWEDAFQLLGRHLRALPTPDAAEFYTSGRASNEAAFLLQLFVREFGTNNFPDCSNMCHEATSVGLPMSIGVGKGTVLLEDFDATDVIIIIGQNPGTNSPRMMTNLREVARRGGKIISFNPFRERALERFQSPQDPVEMAALTSTPISGEIYQVKVGGDIAMLKGLMKAIIEADDLALAEKRPAVLDWDFINGHTAGFEEFVADIRSLLWASIEQQSGLSRAELSSAAKVYMSAEKAILVYGMGITQHVYGTQTVQQISNLAMLRGNIGKPGAGICPVRGHSNVQGDRTVGITEKPSAEFLANLERRFGFKPPARHGHDVVTSLEAMLRGESRVLIALGGNFVSAIPDWNLTWPALRKLDLSVHVSTKLNRSHLVHGREALILPCLGRTELDIQASGPQSVTVEDSMSMVHASLGLNKPASEYLKSEPAIIADMARATLGSRSRVNWAEMIGNYDVVRDAIEDVLPIFQAYNARIKQPGGFHLTSTARERIWTTSTGKANFLVFDGLQSDKPLLASTALSLTTMRSHDQYNTTLYSLSDRYRGIFGRRDVVFMNPREIAKRGLASGDLVDVITMSTDDIDRRISGFTLLEHSLPDGCCGAYYPEANPLVPLYAHDALSHTPSSKSVPVLVERSKVRRSEPILERAS